MSSAAQKKAQLNELQQMQKAAIADTVNMSIDQLQTKGFNQPTWDPVLATKIFQESAVFATKLYTMFQEHNQQQLAGLAQRSAIEPSTGKRKRKKKVLRPGEPKKPLANAFLLYSMETRPDVIKANPGVSFKEISQIIGKNWSEISQKKKDAYVEQIKERKDQYIQDINAFNRAYKEGLGADEEGNEGDEEEGDESEEEEEDEEAAAAAAAGGEKKKRKKDKQGGEKKKKVKK